KPLFPDALGPYITADLSSCFLLGALKTFELSPFKPDLTISNSTRSFIDLKFVTANDTNMSSILIIQRYKKKISKIEILLLFAYFVRIIPNNPCENLSISLIRMNE